MSHGCKSSNQERQRSPKTVEDRDMVYGNTRMPGENDDTNTKNCEAPIRGADAWMKLERGIRIRRLELPRSDEPRFLHSPKVPFR